MLTAIQRVAGNELKAKSPIPNDDRTLISVGRIQRMRGVPASVVGVCALASVLGCRARYLFPRPRWAPRVLHARGPPLPSALSPASPWGYNIGFRLRKNLCCRPWVRSGERENKNDLG